MSEKAPFRKEIAEILKEEREKDLAKEITRLFPLNNFFSNLSQHLILATFNFFKKKGVSSAPVNFEEVLKRPSRSFH